MDLPTRGDEELALAYKAGDPHAFEELVRRHQGRVYAIAYRITGNREDALDVAQDAFVKAFRKIDAWQPTGGFLPWLLRLTVNQSIDATRRRKRRRHESLDESGIEALAVADTLTPGIDTERRVRAGEIAARVQAALEVLSPTQRSVFVMRHYEGLQLAEIAEVLGCTVGSVKVHLFRALRKMQVQLKDFVNPEPGLNDN
ncbi:MAG: RNA polymerase sigma factor [Candidatus Hydrogenedentes bacterium]|nr:RNA polymerase sigma factor [Candidatus Hydrogenedentota bacterium]